MWPTTRYLDFPDLVDQHLCNFKSILIYDPSSPADRLTGVNTDTLSVSADAICVELPPAFSLISVSQIQICVVKGYGKLSVQTTAHHRGRQQLILDQGISYKRDLCSEDRTRLQLWRDKTAYHLASYYNE